MDVFFACEVTFACLFGMCVCHASFANSMHALVVALLYGTAVEYLVYVAMELLEPRLYDHSMFTAMLPGGVPLYIVLLWATFLYVSDQFTKRALLQNKTKGACATLMTHAIIASTLAMSLDTTLEPIATSHGYWKYRAHDPLNRLGPRWLRAPLVNLMAWSCLQSGYSVGLRITDYLSTKSITKSSVCVQCAAQLFAGVTICLLGFAVLGMVRLATSNSDELLAILLAGFGLGVTCQNLGWGIIRERRTALMIPAGNPKHLAVLCMIPPCWHACNLASLFWLVDAFDARSVTTLVVCGALSSMLFNLHLHRPYQPRQPT
jgi:uncharacterized membrane protein